MRLFVCVFVTFSRATCVAREKTGKSVRLRGGGRTGRDGRRNEATKLPIFDQGCEMTQKNEGCMCRSLAHSICRPSIWFDEGLQVRRRLLRLFVCVCVCLSRFRVLHV